MTDKRRCQCRVTKLPREQQIKVALSRRTYKKKKSRKIKEVATQTCHKHKSLKDAKQINTNLSRVCASICVSPKFWRLECISTAAAAATFSAAGVSSQQSAVGSQLATASSIHFTPVGSHSRAWECVD
ncbi:uncharacterized protein Dvir_GJ25870 [Drosophila virilis]|uniref:Uncharacterized protein n=1 Tax=Drosophila virilis TaxID=7244 RepID=A0A0Q9W017_DROVI|nr:uncharacterized protein Dvir_GJ25870 [Drosophila virilis]